MALIKFVDFPNLTDGSRFNLTARTRLRVLYTGALAAQWWCRATLTRCCRLGPYQPVVVIGYIGQKQFCSAPTKSIRVGRRHQVGVYVSIVDDYPQVAPIELR